MDSLRGVKNQALKMKLHKLVDPTTKTIRGCVNEYVSYTATSQGAGVEEIKLVREGSVLRGTSRSSRPATKENRNYYTCVAAPQIIWPGSAR